MRETILLFITTLLCSCTSLPSYTWQDTRQPARTDATLDLEECRAFAARQYRPGVPAGEPYLMEQETKRQQEAANIEAEQHPSEPWRADRFPFATTNLNEQPTHDIPVDYTGYPGELDYYPHYLDDILEKCMFDRGWVYQAESETSQ